MISLIQEIAWWPCFIARPLVRNVQSLLSFFHHQFDWDAWFLILSSKIFSLVGFTEPTHWRRFRFVYIVAIFATLPFSPYYNVKIYIIEQILDKFVVVSKLQRNEYSHRTNRFNEEVITKIKSFRQSQVRLGLRWFALPLVHFEWCLLIVHSLPSGLMLGFFSSDTLRVFIESFLLPSLMVLSRRLQKDGEPV